MAHSKFDWSECVVSFTDADAEELAKWRGYSTTTAQYLHREKLVGQYNGSFALPVHDERGNVIGCHYRKPQGKWAYSDGAKTTPLVIGSIETAKTAHLFESQWDAFAVFDAFGGSLGADDVVIITRGAGNGAMGAKLLSDSVEAFAWMQNDPAADGWLAKIAENAKCPLSVVRTPSAFKDWNDWLKEGATKNDFAKAHATAKPLQDTGTDGLPPMEDAAALIQSDDAEIPELIAGILHRGMKMTVGGSSKSNKTWCLVDLAVSVATGAQWWGFPTCKSRAVYLNFEVAGYFFKQRIKHVCEAKGAQLAPNELIVWNLRGHSANLGKLTPQIIKAVKRAGDVGLIVLDPLYKLMAGMDENAAGDLGTLCNELDKLATQTGAAVVYGAHFSKGNQAGKESIDRISGSGVQARDPDSILTMTKHEEDGAFTVEPVLRNHAPVEPFVVRWEFPIMHRDGELDPAKLKQSKMGAPTKYSVNDIVAEMGSEEWGVTQLQKHMAGEHGMSSGKFYDLWREAKRAKRVHLSPISQKWASLH